MVSTEERIMEATYRVLVDDSYSELSIRRIADEFDGSQSLIYYHYDDKEDLLAGFLTYLLDGFEQELETADTDDPLERLLALVDLVVPQRETPDLLSFHQALGEIRMQTPYHDRYQDQFAAFDARLRSELETTIQRGLDDGIFVDVDASDAAERLQLLLSGVLCHYVPMCDWDGIERGQTIIEAEIESWRPD
ncbi:TetR family transcriptional regulator [Salinigranum rubrum]|uniref:TetR family transcriptional regulator n=1 Tax=Salinigranum rubrum TaxID=755307 RepID=A0A2I8VLP5_9EURY|nr:TetR/AcrR family transcriptional regulator [Salinigranum rubrum]AUV82841.1 TetR family transcriptional regulator [Salinigranum rubrum]